MSRRSKRNLLALILTIACVSVERAALAADYLSEQAAQLAISATVRVLATNETGPVRRRTATGFMWRDKNRVITALHAVLGAEKILIEYSNMPSGPKGGIETSLARIVSEDWNTDLAVLEVLRPSSAVSVFSMYASPKPGEGLWVVGFPLETQGLRSARLYVSEIAPKSLREGVTPEAAKELQTIGLPSLETEVLHLEGSLLPGHSGSPIINSEGAVVAVGDGGLLKGTIGLGWGIPSIHLNRVLQQETRSPPVDLGQLAKVTTSFSSVSLQPSPVVDAQARSVRLRPTEAPSGAQPLAVSLSGQLAIFSSGGALFLIDTTSNRTIVDLEVAPGVGSNGAISPDGRLLAAGTLDGKIIVWDVSTGKIVKTFETGARGDYIAINTVRFSNNSKIIAAGSRSSAYLWDYGTGTLTPDVIEGPVNEVQQLAFSSDDELLAVGQWAGSFSVWKISEGRVLSSVRNIGTVLSLRFSPDRSQLAVNIAGSGVNLYNPNTGVRISTLPVDGIEVGPIEFISGGRAIIGVPEINKQDVCIWTLASKVRKCETSFSTEGGAAFVQLLSDSKTIGWGNRKALIFTDAQTGKTTRLVEPRANSLSTVRLAQRIPSVAWRNTSSAVTTVFDLLTGNVVRAFTSEGRFADLDALAAYSADASSLAVKKGGETLILEPSTGRELLRIPAQGMTSSVAFSADGALVAVGTGARTLDIWRVKEKSLLRSFKLDDVPKGVAFSENSTLIAASASKLTQVWDVASGQRKYSFPLNAWFSAPLLFSPRGDLLAVSEAHERRIRLWNLADSGRFETLKHAYSADVMSFSQDGALLAAGDGSNVRLWDTQKGGPIKQYVPNVGTVRAISFTPDGRLLVVGGALGLAMLSLNTGKVELELRAISGNNWIAINSDGRVAGVFEGNVPYQIIGPSVRSSIDKAYLSNFAASPLELFRGIQAR